MDQPVVVPDFRALFESVPAPLLALTAAPPFTIVAVTAGVARATLYTREDLLGRGFFEVFSDPPDQTGVRKIAAAFERVVKSAAPDGHSSPLFGADGDVRFILHSLDDTLNDLKRAQALTTTGSWRFDMRTRQLVGSDEACRIFGFPHDQPVSYRDFLARIHPDDRQHVDERWRATLHHAAPYDIEYRVVVDTKITWVRACAELTLDAAGAVVGGIGTIQVITDSKEAREALLAARAKLDAIINIASDSIVSFDDDHRIRLFNQGAERIFGWAPADIMGQPVELLMPERFRAEHHQHVREFAAGQAPSRRMKATGVFGLRKNGEEFPAQATISKIDVDGGHLFTIVLRDVTDQHAHLKLQEVLAEIGAVLLRGGLRREHRAHHLRHRPATRAGRQLRRRRRQRRSAAAVRGA
jgi:PAS domain S-box-containing protein